MQRVKSVPYAKILKFVPLNVQPAILWKPTSNLMNIRVFAAKLYLITCTELLSRSIRLCLILAAKFAAKSEATSVRISVLLSAILDRANRAIYHRIGSKNASVAKWNIFCFAVNRQSLRSRECAVKYAVKCSNAASIDALRFVTKDRAKSAK